MLCHQRQLNGPSDQNGPNCQLPSEDEIIISMIEMVTLKVVPFMGK
jgi:hypothetical protein